MNLVEVENEFEKIRERRRHEVCNNQSSIFFLLFSVKKRDCVSHHSNLK